MYLAMEICIILRQYILDYENMYWTKKYILRFVNTCWVMDYSNMYWTNMYLAMTMYTGL